MRRNHNTSSSANDSHGTPTFTSSQDAQVVDGSNSCLSFARGISSDSVVIATSSPSGTPPRKRWEGAFKVFLKGKNSQHFPTLSSSPSGSVASMPITEGLSAGTVGSDSSPSGIVGGMKGTMKKSSFSLIPGSKRFVTRNGSFKNNTLPSIFSKDRSNGHLHRFSRGHKSMDALDIPLRNGKSNTRTNSNETSQNPHILSEIEQLSPRSSSLTTQLQLQYSVPKNIPQDPFREIGLQIQQDSPGINETAKSITLPKATGSFNEQSSAASISSTPSYVIPYTPNPQLARTLSLDWHINPIVNNGVELPLATASAPSLTQLNSRRSHSRTYMYSSNSNVSTPIHQQQQPHQDELNLRRMREAHYLKEAGSHHKRTTSLEFHDVGLNLDDADHCSIYDDHSHKSSSNYSESNSTMIITDCGVSEPPESLDEIIGDMVGMVAVHSSSHLLNKMDEQLAASPETKKAFTKFHNSSEYGQDISPFLGGKKASNRDLAAAYKSCIETQQSMLLRSITTNQNISSDTRIQSSSILHATSTKCGKVLNASNAEHDSPSSFLSQPLPIDTTTPTDLRLLKPIQSADSWVQGRRYLIAPAALAACPLSSIKVLTGLRSLTAMQAAKSVDASTIAGAIELGDAFMTYVGDKYHLTCGKWSSCRLVLRQNYLFEYDLSTPLNSLPRGMAHLQHAFAHTQKGCHDALQLHFYSSPCAKADHRVLLIRLKNKDERDNWITCLNKAARLQIKDIWEYKKDWPLGVGRYASIFPARRKMAIETHRSENRRDQERLRDDIGVMNCALKIIDKNTFWQLVVKGRERCDTIVREIAIQSTLTAEFGTKSTFLQINGFFETSENVVIELELLQGKDLFEYILSKGVIEEREASIIIRDVIVALINMSRAGIAHRDVKPANILMTRCKNCKHGISIKLGDFGMSTLVGMDGLVRGRCGSPGFVAPEILEAEAGEGYPNRVDVFSAGVTLYMMLCGYEPFYGETEKELIKANKKACIDFPDSEWNKISPEAKDLVTKMLKVDSKERITAAEAVGHPWIVRHTQKQNHRNNSHSEGGNHTFRNSDLQKELCGIM